MKKAIVYATMGMWNTVCDESGNYHKARLKGKHKVKLKIKSTNPIAVGDFVNIFKDNSDPEESYVIDEILPRENYYVRIAPQNRHYRHILAANIDQVVILASLTSPRTSQGFIDRLLVSCELYKLKPIICFNKQDLYEEQEYTRWKNLSASYTRAGYPYFLTSFTTQGVTEDISTQLLNKTSLICGHSGVGKSTLLNILLPELEIETADVSDWNGKGKHTTTFSKIYNFKSGKVIDTPGIKEFGVLDVDKHELFSYFPEFFALQNQCKFNNCIHVNEPKCAVKNALETDSILQERYASYRSILDSLTNH